MNVLQIISREDEKESRQWYFGALLSEVDRPAAGMGGRPLKDCWATRGLDSALLCLVDILSDAVYLSVIIDFPILLCSDIITKHGWREGRTEGGLLDMYAWLHACMCLCMYVRACLCMHETDVCMSVCMCARLVHVCMYVCMYVCTDTWKILMPLFK